MVGGILILQTGIEPRPLSVKAWSPNYWIARVSIYCFFFLYFQSKSPALACVKPFVSLSFLLPTQQNEWKWNFSKREWLSLYIFICKWLISFIVLHPPTEILPHGKSFTHHRGKYVVGKAWAVCLLIKSFSTSVLDHTNVTGTGFRDAERLFSLVLGELTELPPHHEKPGWVSWKDIIIFHAFLDVKCLWEARLGQR